jgi:hypothetical protein
MLEIANDVAGPGSTSRPVQTWPGKEGHGTVRAYRSGDSYWLEWPGVARFTFTPGQATTRAMPWPGADRGVVVDAFERFVVPLVLHAGGREALHASAISCSGTSAIAFCAPSGTGKSTVACGLAMRGHTVVTDDGLLVEDGTPPRVSAVTTDVRLRPESSVHFGLSPTAGRSVLGVGQFKTVRSATLGGIIVLDRQPHRAGAVASRLAGGEALAAVLAHAHCLDPTDDQRRALTVARYLEIVASVPVWRLTYPTGFDTLAATLDLIERTAEGMW